MNYQIEFLSVEHKDYPEKITEFVRDKKPIFYSGDLSILRRPSIGIVGSRKCTGYGMAVAKEISKRAAFYDVVVVSGLAKGIDSVAHKSVLDYGGTTIGVLGCGIDVIYPKSNRELYQRVNNKGLLLSEYPPGAEPARYNFPTRNRLISALSDVLVVVEAGARSGSLITAECAMEQGKEVYAVPGNITSVYSMGPNKLIRDGARPLALIEDVFSDLGVSKQKEDNNEDLGEDERALMNMLQGNGEMSVADLSVRMNMPMAEINGIVTILEIKGLIYCEMGKVMIANFT